MWLEKLPRRSPGRSRPRSVLDHLGERPETGSTPEAAHAARPAEPSAFAFPSRRAGRQAAHSRHTISGRSGLESRAGRPAVGVAPSRAWPRTPRSGAPSSSRSARTRRPTRGVSVRRSPQIGEQSRNDQDEAHQHHVLHRLHPVLTHERRRRSRRVRSVRRAFGRPEAFLQLTAACTHRRSGIVLAVGCIAVVVEHLVAGVEQRFQLFHISHARAGTRPECGETP